MKREIIEMNAISNIYVDMKSAKLDYKTIVSDLEKENNKLAKLEYAWYCFTEDRKVIPDETPEDNDNVSRVLMPEELFAKGYGTCWDRSLYLYKYCKSKKLETHYVYTECIQREPKGSLITHTTIVVHLDDWYMVDPFYGIQAYSTFSEFVREYHNFWKNKNYVAKVIKLAEVNADKLLALGKHHNFNDFIRVLRSGKSLI